jgi:hypothetical protein
MARQVTVRPINSIVFVSGGGMVDVPADKLNSRLSWFAASRDCLIVCVYPDVDGPTELMIGEAGEVDPGYAPSFEGTLETRTGRIIIDQVDDHVVYDEAVNKPAVTVKLWFSNTPWPEKVYIGID